jgi:hypothetical protein
MDAIGFTRNLSSTTIWARSSPMGGMPGLFKRNRNGLPSGVIENALPFVDLSVAAKCNQTYRPSPDRSAPAWSGKAARNSGRCRARAGQSFHPQRPARVTVPASRVVLRADSQSYSRKERARILVSDQAGLEGAEIMLAGPPPKTAPSQPLRRRDGACILRANGAEERGPELPRGWANH